jgi:Periplasmic copper-binding protein (NosD)
MSQRQRRRKDQRRKQAERRGPARRQVVAGATVAIGATLAATGSAQAATFTVSNLNDSGAGSLREAILDANDNGNGLDDIVFASGLSGTIDVGTFNGNGLYAGTPMNIHGPGAGQITLRGVNGVGYVVFTGTYDVVGYAGEPITLSGLTLTGGNASGTTYSPNGGGILNRDASLTVTDSVITGNHATGDGAGIFSDLPSGSLSLVNTTVSDNAASSDPSSYGGGIFSGSPAVIRNSTISGNTVGGDGGGVYMSETTSLTIENSTIANNRSTDQSTNDNEGGGVWIYDPGSKLDIKSSTITGNSVGGSVGYGGGVYAGGLNPSDLSIQNTIVANNTGTKGNDVFFYNTTGGVGFSLIKDPANSGPINATGPNITGVDPQLGPLANNGGPTQTEAPSASSPVIDKGNAFGLNTDQRGVLRPIDFPAIPNAADGSDIGAVELQPSNTFKLGKLKRNKKKGTAKQVVILPLPDAGSVTIKGKGLKTKTRQVTGAAKVKLPVIAKGKKRKGLNRSGKAKIKAKVTYTPTGNALTTLKRKLKLLKR